MTKTNENHIRICTYKDISGNSKYTGTITQGRGDLKPCFVASASPFLQVMLF